MNNTYLPTPSILGQDIANAPGVGQHLSLVASRYGAPVLAELQDDDGQISCVCGFNDDDGNTVACDGCNRWQHTICYYPDWEGQDLPEELQHFCVDCRPKPFDAQAANDRQRRIREQQDSLVNGTRRPSAKSHKKKVKDSQSGINGWAPDKTRHDRNSASPRDQQPPTKRPKTNHRTSDTNTSSSLGKGHNRKRTATNVNHQRSHSHSPETVELYSPELLRCYRHDDWAVVQANLHTDIGVTSALTEWLRAPDDEFRDLHGHDKRDILMRWDGQLDDIPGKAQIDIQEMNDEASDAIWKVVTVKEPVAQGAYLGELKGHVGFLSQYKEEPANRWTQLRHPEPFVFFHPSLPVYIDARHEGTELRYVRRSCRPNAKLQILVTDQTDYRFCFMALEQIDPGVEIALAWDTAESVPRTTNGFPPKDMAILSAWVSTVLANCGPCACNTVDCFMSRFDRRRNHGIELEEDVSNLRAAKSRKKKQRLGRGLSPATPHVSNSRSGSEHHRGDMDDEATDLRSTSGSGRGSVSRDITPSTHYSITGGTELSERERKKLAKEEEMFKRQAEEQIHRQGKKKRNSSGIQVNAHSPAFSKASMNPSRSLDAGTQRQPIMPSRTFKKIKSNVPAKQTSRSVDAFTTKRHNSGYADQSTQVDLDEDDARHRQAVSHPTRKFISRRTYLFQYLARREAKAVVATLAKSRAPEKEDLYEIEGHVIAEIPDSAILEVDMPDCASTITDDHIPDVSIRANGERTGSVDPSFVLDDSINAPPEFTQVAGIELSEPSEIVETSSVQQSSRPLPVLHIPSGHDASYVANTTGPKSASSTPISNGHFNFAAAGLPIFSPSVNAAITPSPARKKLSLSDYTKRSKAKDKDGEGKVERDSSPASTASGSNGLARIPVEIKAGEHVSSAAEDTKMEDVLSNEIVPSQA